MDRSALLLTIIAIAVTGCGHAKPVPSGEPAVAPPVAKGDAMSEEYKKLRTADYSVDSAIQEVNDALEQSKTLAPKAGGDAEKALQNVAQLLDGAGESLGNFEESPDTEEEFRKDFASQDERRLRAIKICIDAVGKVGDASDVLDDLSANAPKQFAADLKSISDNVDQAESDLGEAVKAMGGHLPDDSDSQSIDPVQEKGKNP